MSNEPSILSRQLAIIAAVTSASHTMVTVTERRATSLHLRTCRLYEDYRDPIYNQRSELHDLRLSYAFDVAVVRRIDAALHVLLRRISAVNEFIDRMIGLEERYKKSPDQWTEIDLHANRLLEQMQVAWSKWPAYGRAEVMSPAPMPRMTMTTSNGTLMLVPLAETKVL